MCEHKWKYGEKFSDVASRVCCNLCGINKIAKPYQHIDPHEYSIAANEFICFRLCKLLSARGCHINVAEAELMLSSRITDRIQPWGQHGIVLLDYLGDHCRIGPNSRILSKTVWPNWLYWFDHWVGRLDSCGDNNLLLLKNGDLVPVDFGMTFPWAGGVRHTARVVTDLAVKCHPQIEKASSNKVLECIKSLTDDDIWNVVVNDIPKEFNSTNTLVAYWSGLCARRDLLQ